jgi:hypothetical protein
MRGAPHELAIPRKWIDVSNRFAITLLLTLFVAVATIWTPISGDQEKPLITRAIGIRGSERTPLQDNDQIDFSEVIGLELSRAVDPTRLAHAMTITPNVPHAITVFGARVSVRMRTLPSTSYAITIPAGFQTLDGSVVQDQSSFHVRTGAIPPVTPLRATPNEPYRYGTLAHPFSYSLDGPDAERIMDSFVRAGVRFVRIEYPAAQILGETTPRAEPDFSTLDRIAEALRERGITEYPALTQYTVPQFQADGKGYPNLQVDPNDFARYAGIVADHLRRFPEIKRMEIFNEPNAFHWWVYPRAGSLLADQTGKAAAIYMKAAYAAIKKANPSMEVGGPELSVGGHETDPRTFLNNMYEAGCRTGSCWDFLTVHNYRWENPTFHVAQNVANRWDIYKDLQGIAISHGDPKPHVMLTEWGFSTVATPDGFDPAVQAYFIALGFNLMLQDPTVDGVAYVNVYNGGPTDNFYAQTQLMDNDFTPRPGFAVFQSFSKGVVRR